MRKQAATQTKPPKPQGRSSEQVASSQPKPAAKPQADKTAEPSKPAAPPAPSPSVEIQPPATNPTPRTGPVAIPDAFPADLHPPQMLLTEAHAKTCLVKLGEPMPNLTLVDLEDNPQLLADLYGEKLTVVVFWSHSKVFAREQFARLKQEVQQPFSQFGVNVVAINVGDPADVVRSLAAEYDVDLLCLLDPDGTAFAQLATAKLPRTYLLDSQGTIRWFDIEYSQTTARDLRNAIYYYLQP
jgi:peroxiredoxin